MNNKPDRLRLLKHLRLPLQTAVLGFLLTSGVPLTQTAPAAQTTLNLNSHQGEKFLFESEAINDFLPLTIQFVTQKNGAFCGVASIVMVLNALSIPAPLALEFGSYQRFTQQNVFNAKTQNVITSDVISRQGMTLEELGQFLETYPVKARVYHSSDVSLTEFRDSAVNNLQESGNFVLVNYLRTEIGQQRWGHISPLAAYHEPSDRFLILDVARYKYPPVWVKAEDLWKAMATSDRTSGKTRGFVLVNPR